MFWSEQAIAKSSTSENKVINTEPLTLDKWKLPSGYRFISVYYEPSFTRLSISNGDDEITLDEVSEFIAEHNDIGGNTITLISVDSLKWLIQKWPIIWVGVRNEKDELVGFVLALVFWSYLTNQKHRIAHTVYLCVHKRYRSRGLAAQCIREVMRIGTTLRDPVYIGYHQVNKSIGNNSIPINSWLRPLNSKHCQRLGIRLPVKGSHRKVRAAFPTSAPKNIFWRNLDETTFKPIYKSYPVRLCWKDFQRFNTHPGFSQKSIYQYVNNQSKEYKCVGHVCYREWPIRFKDRSKTINVGLIQFFTGSKDALQYTFSRLVETCPFAYFHEMSEISSKLLQEVNALQADQRWINWYNWTGEHSIDSIVLPLY